MGYTVHAQRFNSYRSDWKASVGINAVGSLGTRNPVERLDDYAFKHPLAVAIEHQWAEEFAVELDMSLNGFDKGDALDNGNVISKDLTYFSTNVNFKWYFSEYLFDLEWLDLYAMGGVGLFQISETNTSANLSGGVQFWLNENIALRLQSSAKFAANAKNHLYDNNHFQHVFQVVFRL